MSGRGALALLVAALIPSVSAAEAPPPKGSRVGVILQGGPYYAAGGLVAYGLSFHEVGRMSAKFAQRILGGTPHRELPVETVHRLELVLNLRTARELGLTIAPAVLVRADKVIE